MVAHSLGHTYLYDCELTGTVALNTHNSMSPEYSYIHMFGGKLNSTKASILCAEDGKAVMNLDHVTIGDIADGNLAFAHSGGRLVANLTEMDVSGNLNREEKSYLEVHLKDTTLTGCANTTALVLDAASVWNITGDSRTAVLSIAPRRSDPCGSAGYGNLWSTGGRPSHRRKRYVRTGRSGKG